MSSIHERFEINVPAAAVYETLSQPEQVVGTLPGVGSIYRFERDRYRVDIGAAGRSNELDLEITERVPQRHIAWQSRDGRWTGSMDVESLGESRSLVIVQVTDHQAPLGEADSAEDAGVVDSALRALKQSLETAAAQTADASIADAGAGEDVHVRQRAPGEHDYAGGAGGARDGAGGARSARDDRRERAGSERDGGTGRAGGERARAESDEDSGEDRWRGSRGLFRGGGDQAFAMMRSLSREMDKLWDQVMRRAASAGRGTASFTGGWTPAIETCEHGDVLRICAEVPGVKSEDLHVEVDPQLLVIRGERRSDNPEGATTRSERVYGSFVRRIPLPDGLRTEEARARMRHGVLEVRIPVAKLKRGREVPVENADAEPSGGSRAA